MHAHDHDDDFLAPPDFPQSNQPKTLLEAGAAPRLCWHSRLLYTGQKRLHITEKVAVDGMKAKILEGGRLFHNQPNQSEGALEFCAHTERRVRVNWLPPLLLLLLLLRFSFLSLCAESERFLQRSINNVCV